MEKSTKEKVAKKSVKTKKEKVDQVKNTTLEKKTKKASSKSTTKKTTPETSKKTRATATSKTTKSSTTKKATTSTKKKVTSKKIEDSPKMKIDILEYYDLPYRYNQTVVKLLFQTPKTLFVYWDITDEDRDNYKKQYGEHFFENTIPVLVIHNQTMNYSFEIEINDFANSWYFNVSDADCKYVIELGRRPRNQYVSIPNNYLYITSSNQLDAPNDRVLFNNSNGKIIYKNAKTLKLSQRDFGSITFMNNLKNIYSISDFYHKMYDENIIDEIENHSIKNPSSGII